MMMTLLYSGNIGRKICCPLLINKHAPLRRKRVKGKKSPWITYIYVTYYVAYARDFLKRTHAKTNDPVTWLKFNKARNDVNNFIRVAKRKYLSENLNAKVKKQSKYRRLLKSCSNVITINLPRHRN